MFKFLPKMSLIHLLYNRKPQRNRSLTKLLIMNLKGVHYRVNLEIIGKVYLGNSYILCAVHHRQETSLRRRGDCWHI